MHKKSSSLMFFMETQSNQPLQTPIRIASPTNCIPSHCQLKKRINRDMEGGRETGRDRERKTKRGRGRGRGQRTKRNRENGNNLIQTTPTRNAIGILLETDLGVP